MFLVCGEALYDVFPETPTRAGIRLDARIGGSPFNVAVGLARLGRDAGLFTGLSTDALGNHLAAVLEEEGVTGRFLARKPNLTTLAYVGVGQDGHAAYSFYGAEAADRAVTPGDLPVLNDGVRGVHFGSYSLVVEPTGSSFLALAEREKPNRLITLDPNVRLAVEPDVAIWRERVGAFAALADIIKVSDDDLAALWPGEPVEAVARRWQAGGASLVIVTRGARGASAFLRGEMLEVPATPVAVIDTVGAGDTFMAALLCAIDELWRASRSGLPQLTVPECLRVIGFASSAAAITCSRRGADLPRRTELPAV